jgi:hypothetical protein
VYKILIAIFFLLLTFGCGEKDSSSTIVFDKFMPENSMWIDADDKTANMTEATFNRIMDEVNAVYAPIVAKKGAKLVFERNWKDGTVNAYASQTGKVWKVAMFGGLARSKEVTEDGFAMVVCHELGHHLGGAPKYGDADWASNEGQSDYWATLKCFRKVYGTQDSVKVLAAVVVPETVKSQCSKAFNKENDIALCIRSSMGGISLATLLAFGGTTPTVDTPDSSVVSSTQDAHPEAQCRLDTYFAGALCGVSADVDVSATDVKIGSCMSGKASRPLCWFKP